MTVSFGEQMRLARQDRGWSQQHLANLLGISRRTLIDLEHDRVDSAKYALAIGRALNLPLGALSDVARAGGAARAETPRPSSPTRAAPEQPVGQRLKTLRQAAGLSVRFVARAVGRPATTYAAFEDRSDRETLPLDLVRDLVPVFAAREIAPREVLALAGIDDALLSLLESGSETDMKRRALAEAPARIVAAHSWADGFTAEIRANAPLTGPYLERVRHMLALHAPDEAED
ncbi:MAG: helix-turn-helix domain-containing protein [Inquilinaceae bacterium]